MAWWTIGTAHLQTPHGERASQGHDTAATAGAEGRLFGAEALPQDSALPVVKRGPNAGSRFLLEQATTAAGRHPNSDIFLDGHHRQPPARPVPAVSGCYSLGVRVPSAPLGGGRRRPRRVLRRAARRPRAPAIELLPS